MTRQPSGGVLNGRLIPAVGGTVLGALAILTGVISYQHGLEVVRASGTTGRVAYLVPLVADLLIAASSLAILYASKDGVRWPPLPWIGLVFGIAATLAMNVAAGLQHGKAGALVSALAPIALLLSYETLMDMIRRARNKAAEDTTTAHVEQSPQCPHGPAAVGMDAAVEWFLHARDCLYEGPRYMPVAAAFKVDRNKLRDLIEERDRTAAGEAAERPAGEPGSAPEAHTDNGRVHAVAAGPEGA